MYGERNNLFAATAVILVTSFVFQAMANVETDADAIGDSDNGAADSDVNKQPTSHESTFEKLNPFGSTRNTRGLMKFKVITTTDENGKMRIYKFLSKPMEEQEKPMEESSGDSVDDEDDDDTKPGRVRALSPGMGKLNKDCDDEDNCETSAEGSNADDDYDTTTRVRALSPGKGEVPGSLDGFDKYYKVFKITGVAGKRPMKQGSGDGVDDEDDEDRVRGLSPGKGEPYQIDDVDDTFDANQISTGGHSIIYKVTTIPRGKENQKPPSPKDTFEADDDLSDDLEYQVLSYSMREMDEKPDHDDTFQANDQASEKVKYKVLSYTMNGQQDSYDPKDTYEDTLNTDVKRTYKVLKAKMEVPHQSYDPKDTYEDTLNTDVKRTYKVLKAKMEVPHQPSKDCDNENGCKDAYGGFDDEKYPARAHAPGKGELNTDTKRTYKVLKAKMEVPDQKFSYEFDLSPPKGKDFSPGKYQEKEKTAAPFISKLPFRKFPPLEQTEEQYVEVEMNIKPVKGTGILLYNGWKQDEIGDFISLALQNGYAELSFNCGSGIVRIRAPKPVDMNMWNRITFYRSERLGYLTVNSYTPVTGLSPGPHTILSLHQNLYVGGVGDGLKHEVEQNVGTKMSFRGYIQDLRVNGKVLNLVTQKINKTKENKAYPCPDTPCANGVCLRNGDQYSCSCDIYYKGRYCEGEIDVRPLRFTESSYAHINKSLLLKALNKENSVVSFYFKTTQTMGLILLEVQNINNYFKRRATLSLHEGSILFSYNVGFGRHLVQSRHLVNDGLWHKVAIKRTDKACYLEIDDIYRTKFRGFEKIHYLRRNVDLYIGTPVDISQKSENMFKFGFNGCLREFKIENQYLDFNSDTIFTDNLMTCDNK